MVRIGREAADLCGSEVQPAGHVFSGRQGLPLLAKQPQARTRKMNLEPGD